MRTERNHGFLATKDFRKHLLRKQDLGLSEQQPAPNDLGVQAKLPDRDTRLFQCGSERSGKSSMEVLET